jgi:leader peptidase (prepilin peptidase) / N-methyltransferase
MLAIFILITGLFIGSFLGVMVDRLPQNKTIVKGRSHCDFCKKELNWYDLIPVLSFISTRGKCRYCKHSLPYFYPVIEITTGVMFAITYLFTIYHLPFSNFNQIVNYQFLIVNVVYYLFIMSSFIVIFFTDLKSGIIPDKVLLSGVVVSIISQLIIAPQLVFINLFSGIGAFLFFLIISVAFSALTKKDAMGGGDIKLVFLLGLFLGFPNIVIALYIAFLTGALAGIILIIWKKKQFRKATLPFGTFLILGSAICLFWGNIIYAQISHFLGF